MKKLFLIMLMITGIPYISYGQSSYNLTKAINNFQSTLNNEELKLASFQFEDSLRTKWTNLPVGLAERNGIRYGDLREESKIRFHDILTNIFSSQGYLKTTNIMHLDDYLLEIYEIAHANELINDQVISQLRTFKWGQGSYFISIWGDVLEDAVWGFKFEGHHITLNLTSVDGQLSITPLFLGTDPALVRVTKNAGMRPLSKEEDYGLELFNMFTPEQKNKAIISDEFPEDIITAPGKLKRLTTFQGIKGDELSEKQKKQLEYLIMEYLRNFERDKVGSYLDRLNKNGIDEIYFGWIGGNKRVSNHYYVINGPDFLIEYDNAGWIYEGDHIHTIFRDKSDDFGEDILKTHYLQHKH